MKAPVLKSERLILRPLNSKHATMDYVGWMNDGEINKYLESGGDYTLQKLKEFLKEQVAKNIYFWAIHLKDGDLHIGNIKIDPIDPQSNSGEYGILMGEKKEWGKGYAREASETVIRYCFEELGLRKITLGVIDRNEGAVSLYRRLGFKTYDRILGKGEYAGVTCDVIRMELINGSK